MAANTGDFKDGGSSARGEDIGIIPPVAPGSGSTPKRPANIYIPLKRREAEAMRRSGYVIPDAPVSVPKTSKPEAAGTTSLDKDLKFYTQLTGKKAVGMNDTLTIADHFIGKLEAAHAAVSASSSHPDLATAREFLSDARNHIVFARNAKKNEPVLDEAGKPVLTKKGNPAQRNQTPLAWAAIEHAGKQIQKASGLIKGISPDHVNDISYTHIIHHENGTQTHLTFTPSSGLSAATQQPGTGFRERGRAVTELPLAGRNVKLPQNTEANLAVRKREQELGIAGTEALRPEAVGKFRQKKSATRRVRKIERVPGQGVRTGETSPKSKLPLVEPMGGAAVQPSRVGDWGGSEKRPVSPGENYPRGAEKIATRKLRGAKKKQERALADLKLAGLSSEKDAPQRLAEAKKATIGSAVEVAKGIAEVKAARARDISYATGTPKAGTRKFPKPKPAAPKKDGK